MFMVLLITWITVSNLPTLCMLQVFFFFFVKLESHSTFKKRVYSYINT